MEWYLARNKAEEGPAHEKLKRLASEFRTLFIGSGEPLQLFGMRVMWPDFC